MQQWILVNAEGLLTSIERAKIISRELYNITRPAFLQHESEAESMLFSFITHPTRKNDAALLVDTRHVIQVHPSCSL